MITFLHFAIQEMANSLPELPREGDSKFKAFKKLFPNLMWLRKSISCNVPPIRKKASQSTQMLHAHLSMEKLNKDLYHSL